MLGVYVLYVMAKALTAEDRKENMTDSEARRVSDLADADMTRADMTDALDEIDRLEGVKTPMGRGAEILVTTTDAETARDAINAAGFNVETNDDGTLTVYFTETVECEHDCDNDATHDVVISTVDETASAFVCEAHKEAHERHGVLDYAEKATDDLIDKHYPRLEA